MKITEFKNEAALDLLMDLLEPVSKILTDKEIVGAIKSNKSKLGIARIAVKNHKSEVIEILAITDGVPVEKYTCNPITIITKLMELLNDKELIDFLSSQGQQI